MKESNESGVEDPYPSTLFLLGISWVYGITSILILFFHPVFQEAQVGFAGIILTILIGMTLFASIGVYQDRLKW